MTDAGYYLEMLATAHIREEWAKTLKEGDEVVLRTSWPSARNGTTRKIKKITKTGRIRLENGVLFGSDAMRVERGWGLMILEEHLDAEPGGDPDLFDMPLPLEIASQVEGQEWPGSPEWGEQDEGIIGTSWGIGKSGYEVVVTDRESYIRDPEGFRV